MNSEQRDPCEWRVRPIVLAIAMAVASGVTFAQESSDDEEEQVATEEAVEEAANLGSVTVTARRREESLQEVPIAVTALGEDQLQEYGVQTLEDLTALAPNVKINAGRGTNSTINAYIRGVGQNDPLWGFEPGVGLYMDDVYIARPQGALLDVYDVERVEILRGPQGTLYGKNTIAGAIKYVSRDIVGDSTYKVTGVVGTDSQVDLKVSGSMPINENVYIGGAVARFLRDGYGNVVDDGSPQQYNRVGDEVSDKDVLAVRGSIAFLIGDSGRFSIMADALRDDSNIRGAQRLNDDFGNRLPSRYDVRNDTPVGNEEVVMNGFAANYTQNLNNNWDMKFIASWREGKTKSFIDFETLNTNAFNVPARYDDSQSSLEAQFNYQSDDGRWSAVTGLYGFDGDACGAFDVVLGAINFTSLTQGCVYTRSYAAYGDVTFALNERANISIGGRFNRDDKEASVFVGQYLGALPGNGTFFNPNRPPEGFTLLAVQTDYQNAREYDDFTPKFSFDYAFTDSVMGYASYTNGFKSGGFDMRGNEAVNPDTRNGYDSETVDNYEIGLKSVLADGRLVLNVTAFSARYEDVQVTTQQFVDVGGIPTNVTAVLNAGEQRNNGLEFEAFWQITDNFRLDTVLGYLDADFTEFKTSDPNNPGQIIDISNTVSPINAPELTGYISGEYVWPMRDGDFSARLGYQYRDDTKTANITPSVTDQKAYSLVDATIAYTTYDGHWRFSLDGRNLTDEEYITSGYDFGPAGAGLLGGLSQLGFYGAPRSIFFTASYRY